MSLRLSLRNDVWQVTGTVMSPEGERMRVRKSTGFTKHQKAYASEAMSKILRDALSGRLKKTEKADDTIADGIRLYLTRPNPPGATDVQCLRRFEREFGDVKMSEVSVSDIQLYVQSRGNKAGTVAREINTINAMLTHARNMGMDVAEVVLKRPSVDDARLRWLDEEQRDRLIASCDPQIRGLVCFLFFTGCRLGEAFALTWDDVLDKRAFFRTRKGRAKKTRTRAVPLVQEALDAIGERGHGLVFKTSTGTQWERSAFYKHFGPACVRAGIDDFRPHDCRHTFASHLIQRGASLRAVADLLGHTSLSMVMRYAHLAPSHLESTVGLLGAVGTKLTHAAE